MRFIPGSNFVKYLLLLLGGRIYIQLVDKSTANSIILNNYNLTDLFVHACLSQI